MNLQQFCIYFNLQIWQLIFPSLMFKFIYSATSAPLFHLFILVMCISNTADIGLRVNMTTAHPHVSIVITALGGWWLGISVVTEADEWSLFSTLAVVGKRLCSTKREASHELLISSPWGGHKHCRGEHIPRGWCHAWGLVGVMSSRGGDVTYFKYIWYGCSAIPLFNM